MSNDILDLIEFPLKLNLSIISPYMFSLNARGAIEVSVEVSTKITFIRGELVSFIDLPSGRAEELIGVNSVIAKDFKVFGSLFVISCGENIILCDLYDQPEAVRIIVNGGVRNIYPDR